MPIGNSSHEGLMLDWEQAMTREFNAAGLGLSPKENGFYNTSAHFLWVGDRTRQLDGAHIEYFRGIRNPIGIKVGPSLGNDELINLLESMHEFSRSRTGFRIYSMLFIFDSRKSEQRERPRDAHN
jgi:3-deoxy-D-arabino-heptulosonate 7-phosphate (DAHP) synthase class II